MELRNLGNGCIKGIKVNEDQSYTIETQRTFSEVAEGEDYIVGFDEKRLEIITYSKNSGFFSKMDMPICEAGCKIQKHKINNKCFWTVGNSIMYFSKGEVIWLSIPEVVDITYRIYEISKIFSIYKKRFFIKASYYSQVYMYMNEKTQNQYLDMFFEIDMEERKIEEIKGFKADDGYDYEYESRFVFQYWWNWGAFCIDDMLTKRSFLMRAPISNRKDIIVKYSSKDIIILKNKVTNECYLYILGGYPVYKYESEEHDKVISDLKKYYIVGKCYSTVTIGNKLCIWSKNGELEQIDLDKPKKSN